MHAALLLLLMASQTFTTPEFQDLVARTSQSAGGTILVGAPGKDAEKALRTTLGASPVMIVRVALLGDPEREMAAALSSASLSCGLRAELSSFGVWSVTTHGNCAAGRTAVAMPGGVAASPAQSVPGGVAPSPAAAATPAASAPTRAAPTSDPLVEALIALPPGASRQARLTSEIVAASGDSDRVACLGQAMVVLANLEAAKRTDPSLLRAFLRSALSPDATVRTQAVVASASGGDPPSWAAPSSATPATPPATPRSPTTTLAPGPQPLAPPAPALPGVAAPSPEREQALRRYKSEHLLRGEISDVRGAISSTFGGGVSGYAYTVHTWTVYDGGGRSLSVRDFASQVGDSSMLSRLDRRRNVVVGVTVISAVAASLATWKFLEDPIAFWGFGLGAAAGVTVAIGAPINEIMLRTKVSPLYKPPQADEQIRRYNDRLRQRLGLTPEDVRGIDLSLNVSPGEIAVKGTF